MDQGYDVEVEFMDGEKKTYPKVTAARQEGCLLIYTPSRYGGASTTLRWMLPLNNIREIEYK